jgi:hypothetical protein
MVTNDPGVGRLPATVVSARSVAPRPLRPRVVAAAVALGFLASFFTFAVGPTRALASGNAIIPNSSFTGFTDSEMEATDDGSSADMPFGFNINYFGTDYSGAYVNNNGNLTFNAAMTTYTPFGLSSTGTPIVAPFFADVDTMSGNTVNIGTGTLDGHKVFVANWPGVECYPASNSSVLDYFQVILIDRSDLGTGAHGDDFQIEFNYDSIQWDAGQASGGNSNCTDAPAGDAAAVGYSNGTSSDSYELPGSQTTGAFLDSNATTGLIDNDISSDTATSVPPSGTAVPGRYIFNVENGTPITPTSLSTSLSGGGASGTSISVDPGTAVSDSATLSGGNVASAGGTVTYGVYGDASCTDLLKSAGIVNVTDGAVPVSTTYAFSSLGSYYWEASYSGDSLDASSTSGCSEVETVMVLPTTTTSTGVDDASSSTAWSGAEVTGASAYATSTVTGVVGYPPTGTLTYDFFRNASCTGIPSTTQNVTLTAGVVPNSSVTAALGAGSYSFKAAYSGDSTYDASTSGCEGITVAKASVSTGAVVNDAALSSAWNGDEVTGASAYGTATVTGVAGFTPTGTMTYRFYSSATCGGGALVTDPVTLSGGGTVPMSSATGPLTAASYGLEGSYSGDSNYRAGTSSCESFTVLATASGVGTVVDDAGPDTAWNGAETVGSSAYDTATVTTVGGITPTGTLTYSLYTNASCSGEPSSTDTVTLSGGDVPVSTTTSRLGAGSYSYRGGYSGDGNYQAGTGSCEPFAVVKSSASLGTVVEDAGTRAPWSGTETVGAAAYATATVPGVSGFTVTGGVTYNFFGNGTCTGAPSTTDTVSLDAGSVPASTSTGALGPGPQGFDASYSGDANYQPSSVTCRSFTVLEAPAITSADGTTFSILRSGTFTVTATGYPSGAGISLSDGGASLPSGVSFVVNGDGTATLAGTPALGTVGSYPFAIIAANGVGPDATQDFVLTVGLAGTAIVVSSSTNPSVVGESVTLVASVTGSSSGSPTGTVSFEEGASPIIGCSNQPLSSGSAACMLAFATAATHPLAAVYSGDDNFETSTSGSLSQIVGPAATTTVTVSSASPAMTGESVIYTVSVARTSPATGTAAGSVAFTDSGNPVTGCGAVVVTGGLAACTVTYSAIGSHDIVAAYGGDADDVASVAPALTEQVDQDPTVTTITSSPNPSVVGELVTITATVKAAVPGSGNPTGTVTFHVDGTAVATLTLDSSVDSRAVYSTVRLAVGSHAITATYGGDAGYLGSSTAVSADFQSVGLPVAVPATGAGTGGWAAFVAAPMLLMSGLALVVWRRRFSRVRGGA